MFHILIRVRCWQCYRLWLFSQVYSDISLFEFAFPWENIKWRIFSYARYLYFFFGEESVQAFGRSECLFSYYEVLKVLSKYWIRVPYQLCLLEVFSLILACLFILSTSFTDQFLILMEPISSVLKSYCNTKRHLDFLLCYLLGVLEFCTLCVGLWCVMKDCRF